MKRPRPGLMKVLRDSASTGQVMEKAPSERHSFILNHTALVPVWQAGVLDSRTTLPVQTTLGEGKLSSCTWMLEVNGQMLTLCVTLLLQVCKCIDDANMHWDARRQAARSSQLIRRLLRHLHSFTLSDLACCASSPSVSCAPVNPSSSERSSHATTTGANQPLPTRRRQAAPNTHHTSPEPNPAATWIHGRTNGLHARAPAQW